MAPNGNDHDRALDGAGHLHHDPLNSPELYLNRELTWLAFNQRVLAEAEDDTNPLLERVLSASTVLVKLGGTPQYSIYATGQNWVGKPSPGFDGIGPASDRTAQ